MLVLNVVPNISIVRVRWRGGHLWELLRGMKDSYLIWWEWGSLVPAPLFRLVFPPVFCLHGTNKESWWQTKISLSDTSLYQKIKVKLLAIYTPLHSILQPDQFPFTSSLVPSCSLLLPEFNTCSFLCYPALHLVKFHSSFRSQFQLHF